MIYLDNAATTKYKPEAVYAAFDHYVREIGVSPGRGSYQLGIQADRMLYQTRKLIGEYFGLAEPGNVVFTKNSTEAINLFFHGMLKKGDHVVITCYEHNAVLRPLHLLKERGFIDYSVIEREDLEKSPEEIVGQYIKPGTKVFAATLASNLTGRVIFNEGLARLMKKRGIVTFVDASQGAGKMRLHMDGQSIDYLAFTGHKDLLALPGVGGLCCRWKDRIEPLIQGGTGIFGDSYINPLVFPEGLEAGTLNMPAIWSLNQSIHYILENYSKLCGCEKNQRKYMLSELKKLEHVEIYDADFQGLGAVAFQVKNRSSSEIVSILGQKNICVRGGIHCAVLAHEALGTVGTGAVRASIGYGSSMEDIDGLVNALKECG